MGRSLSAETSFLIQHLRDAKPDQLITFDDFTNVIGSDIQKHRSSLSTAIRIVERDHGVVVQSVPSVGYRIVAQNTVAKIAEQKGVNGIKREVKRWGDRLSTVDTSKLDEIGKSDYGRSSMRLAVAAASVTEEALKRIEPEMPKGQFKYCKEDALRALATGVS